MIETKEYTLKSKQQLTDFVDLLNNLSSDFRQSEGNGIFILGFTGDDVSEASVSIYYRESGENGREHCCFESRMGLTGTAAREPEVYFPRFYSSIYKELIKECILKKDDVSSELPTLKLSFATIIIEGLKKLPNASN